MGLELRRLLQSEIRRSETMTQLEAELTGEEYDESATP